MKCMHLITGKNISCKALEKTYVPSLFQLVEYCRSRDHRKCPLYLRGIIAHDRRGGAAGASTSFSGM